MKGPWESKSTVSIKTESHIHGANRLHLNLNSPTHILTRAMQCNINVTIRLRLNHQGTVSPWNWW